jgi:rfaE bifunctional protein kinase chain/domain
VPKDRTESARLQEIAARFHGGKVLVLGEVMLDEYVWGRVSRISPEAPVPVVEVERVSHMPGGAANAAVNVASLGGDVLLAGVVGADSTAEKLDSLLRDVGIDTAGLKVVDGRATTLKTRVIAHQQQVVRVDREVGGPIDKAIVDDIIEYMLDSLAEVDGLLISDYAKGVSAPDVLSKGIAAAKALGKPVVVDPKGSDFSKYCGATVITPNRSEAVEASGVEISDDASVVLAGETLVREVGCDAVLITRGENGMSLFDEDGVVTHLPTFARAVYDVTGAGDTVAGTLALALATGAKLADCARIANVAAGVVVGKVGTAVLTAEELQSSLGRSGT